MYYICASTPADWLTTFCAASNTAMTMSQAVGVMPASPVILPTLVFKESNGQELLDPLPKKRCVFDIGARAYAITTDARDRQKSIQNLFCASLFHVSKKLSMRALSWQRPVPLILRAILWRRSALRNSWLVNWLPRSE